MPGIDGSRIFKPLRIAVLIVSDSRTIETDTSGELLCERIKRASHTVHERRIVRDVVDAVRSVVEGWCADPDVDAVITSGGTGLSGRDVTIEALAPRFDKVIDGFSVIFHKVSYDSVGLSTLQSRAMAGLIHNTVVFCLPGSNGAVQDGWDKIIVHQLDSRYRPCNLVELMPRFSET